MDPRYEEEIIVLSDDEVELIMASGDEEEVADEEEASVKLEDDQVVPDVKEEEAAVKEEEAAKYVELEEDAKVEAGEDVKEDGESTVEEEAHNDVEVEETIKFEEEGTEEVAVDEAEDVNYNVPVHRESLWRLATERRFWRRHHPFGFVARPTKNADGSLNLYNWECSVPGKVGTHWAGGNYKLRLIFPLDYPTSPPKCVFEPALLHPNINEDGSLAVPALFVNGIWMAGFSVEFILREIQVLLSTPDLENPASEHAFALFRDNHAEYVKYARAQALCYSPGFEDE